MEMLAKVLELLNEIKSLRTRREEMALALRNPRLASRIQADIFRTFMVIDGILDSDSYGILTGPESWWGLDRLVSEEKIYTEATAEDLEKMRIPRLTISGRYAAIAAAGEADDQDDFPLYMDLPKEVREVILGNLVSASDKLNVIRAIPCEGGLMKWEKLSLQFEMVFPILMKLKKLRPDDVAKLIGVSDSFKNLIMKWVENSLKDDPSYEFQMDADDTVKMFKDNNIQLDAIPFQVAFEFESMDNEAARKQLDALNEIGTNIWDCIIFIEAESHRPMFRLNVMHIIRACLLQMPNLRRLEVFCSYYLSDVDDYTAEELELIDNVALPDLPHLLFLKLEDLCLKYVPLFKSLLRSYYPGLVGAMIHAPALIPKVTAQHTHQMSKLEFVSFDADKLDNVMESLQSLGTLVGQPLKVFRLRAYTDDESVIDSETFPNLMKVLSRLGETLEELYVELPAVTHEIGESHDPSWFANVNFPKVKALFLGNSPGDWNFLLQFPVLENLTIDTHWWGDESIRCGPKKILDLSRDADSVMESNIWKIFPFLRDVELRVRNYSALTCEDVFKVSREDCMMENFSE